MIKTNKLLGIGASFTIAFIVFSSLISLFVVGDKIEFISILDDPYIVHIIKFSFYQAFLSTLLSIAFSIFLALSLYRRDFKGKKYLIKLFSMSITLPVLIAVFGIVSIYGNSGLINSFFKENIFNIYGLKGILLAHLFFNIPLASKIIYESLCLIEEQQHKISTQLGLSATRKFLYLEWPVIKQQIPHLASFIFMLCFTSFAIVLALGGSAKYSTIEVAIYQAIKYDFDLPLAGLLSLVQVSICIFLAFLIQKFSKTIINKSFYDKNTCIFIDSKNLKFFDFVMISLVILLVIPPLLSIVYSGFNSSFFNSLTNMELYNAVKNSLLIALFSSFLAMLFGLCIVLASKEFKMEKSYKKASAVETLGTIILIIPSLVLSTGLFILLNQYISIFDYSFFLVVLVNSFMALPFVIRTLSQSFFSIEQEYKNLCATLGIFGLNRLKLVEFKALKNPIATALTLSFILSFGDLSAIALFGSSDFKTLPLLLYEQMGSYQMDAAALSALILLLISLGGYSLIENTISKS